MAFFEQVKITGNAGAVLDGTAGTPSAGVVTVQGVASGTPQPVSDTQTTAINGKITDDVDGNLRVNPAGQTGSYATSLATGTGAAPPVLTVPAGQKWLVYGLQIQITVANSGSPRQMGFLTADASGNTIVGVQMALQAPINVLSAYSIGPGLPVSSAFVFSNASYPFAVCALGPGSVIKPLISGGVAGDTPFKILANYIVLPD